MRTRFLRKFSKFFSNRRRVSKSESDFFDSDSLCSSNFLILELVSFNASCNAATSFSKDKSQNSEQLSN